MSCKSYFDALMNSSGTDIALSDIFRYSPSLSLASFTSSVSGANSLSNGNLVMIEF